MNKQMSMTYLNELKKAFEALPDKDDYTHFVGELKCLEKTLNHPFYFGTYKQIVSNYTTNFLGRSYDLIFGFYTETPIEFDIFVDNIFKSHYTLEKGKFYPLLNENSEKIVVVSVNTSQENTCCEIRNLTAHSHLLIFLGAQLNQELRKETTESKICEFTLE